MKQKNLPNDINIKSLSELKDMANNIVEKLEKGYEQLKSIANHSMSGWNGGGQ